MNKISAERGSDAAAAYVIEQGGGTQQDRRASTRLFEKGAAAREGVTAQGDAEGEPVFLNVRNKMAAVESVHRPVELREDACRACDVRMVQRRG